MTQVATNLPPVRILCATNEAYVVPLCVALTSLAMHLKKGRGLEICVLTWDVSAEAREKVARSICANRPGFDAKNLRWLAPDPTPLQDLYLESYFTRDAYSRLLAPSVLPPDWDRVLYLDCDVVIRADVSELYDSLDDGYAVHAVSDIEVYAVSLPEGVFNYAELGIPPDNPYFNSGVLLMNLRRWREDGIADRIIAYLKRHGTAIIMMDQGAMNAVLHDSWKQIDPAWNQNWTIHHPRKYTRLGYSMADWYRILTRPKIIHFTGDPKPWRDRQRFLLPPRHAYYFRYLARTEYRSSARAAPPLELMIGAGLYYRFWSNIRPFFLRLSGRWS